jgi:hypothetical protein
VIGGALAAIVVAVFWYARRGDGGEVHSDPSSSVGVASQHTTPVGTPVSSPGTSGSTTASGADHLHLPETIASGIIGSAQPYPVNLDALRTRLPGNRFWELGAPTADPEVAKARAARAERDNAALGRIQANEASPAEIRAYYGERRAISRDYLELANLVLTEQGDQLPERDRGMFELTVNLHKARLQQIDRDESDALGRIAARGSAR